MTDHTPSADRRPDQSDTPASSSTVGSSSKAGLFVNSASPASNPDSSAHRHRLGRPVVATLTEPGRPVGWKASTAVSSDVVSSPVSSESIPSSGDIADQYG